jgi:hypothetical protein
MLTKHLSHHHKKKGRCEKISLYSITYKEMTSHIKNESAAGAGDGGDDVYEKVVVPSGLQQIITNEKGRLEDKESKVNSVYDTKIRKDEFMKSEISRKRAYQNMFYVFLAVCILVLLIYLAQGVFFIIPDLIYALAYIIVISGGIITLLLQYMEIQKRSRMDFNKIDFGYLLDSNKMRDPNAKNSSVLTRGTFTDADCTGKDCCPNGVFKNNRCINETFVTIGPSNQPNPEPPKETQMTTNKSNSSDFKDFTQQPTYSSTV